MIGPLLLITASHLATSFALISPRHTNQLASHLFFVGRRSIPSISMSSSQSVTDGSSSLIQVPVLPKLVVFDLDDCLWRPEMYTLDEVPTASRVRKTQLGRLEDMGVTGVYSGHDVIQLYPYALEVLQDIYMNKYGDIRIAAASSANTPRAVEIGRAAMTLLEIVPGVTMDQVFARGWPIGFTGHLQIGRTAPLSEHKYKTHFPILRSATGLEYRDMLFFDDCNWSDHCAMVEKHCPGVVTVRTPHGLQRHEWTDGLRRYSDTCKLIS